MNFLPVGYCLMAWPASYRLRLPRQSGSDHRRLIWRPAVFDFNRPAGKINDAAMSPVSLLLNILWVVLGGAWMAFGWLIAAVIMAITIVGLPWARAAIQHRQPTRCFPFGFRAAVARRPHRAARISAPGRSA